MTVHVLELNGCRADVLAHYLKALAVFRLVATQRDAGARAFWRHGTFVLASSLDRPALETFFLEAYAPTPLVAPWNGGSGFFPKDNTDAIRALEKSKAERFEVYRAVIQSARRDVRGMKASPKDEEKFALIASARAHWPEAALSWLDAALALTDEGVRYPALLGTGGNDGRLDFTNNFMQRLVELFDPTLGQPCEEARGWLNGALFQDAVDRVPRDIAVGQFLPGGAGGPNSTSGFEGDVPVNPWDFVLALEGTIAFQVAAVRRLDTRDHAQAAAPFAVRASAAGYASAHASDESSRGEQWMPVWSSPATWTSFERLLLEGRMLSGRESAGSAIEAAVAIGRSGAARGIDAFQRFGFIERNGQANLAVPLGAWRVSPRPNAGLVDAVEDWVARFKRAASDKGAPAGAARRARGLEAAMLAALRHVANDRLESLLVKLAEAEDWLLRSSKWAFEARLRPLPQMDAQLVGELATRTGDAELEIARALAALDGAEGALRHNCLPLDEGGWSFVSGGDRLIIGPDVMWRAHAPVNSLAAIAFRRSRTTTREGYPFRRPWVTAGLDAVGRFLDGRTDDLRLGRLARAMMAIRWRGLRAELPASDRIESVSFDYSLCRLAWSYAFPEVGTKSEYRPDARVPRLLARGSGDAALAVAERRLASVGVRLKVDMKGHALTLPPKRSCRLAAALLIPVADRDLSRLLTSIRRHTPTA